jgi:hypothetical protein
MHIKLASKLRADIKEADYSRLQNLGAHLRDLVRKTHDAGCKITKKEYQEIFGVKRGDTLFSR